MVATAGCAGVCTAVVAFQLLMCGAAAGVDHVSCHATAVGADGSIVDAVERQTTLALCDEVQQYAKQRARH